MIKHWGQLTGYLCDMGQDVSGPHGDGMMLIQVSGVLVFPQRDAPASLTSSAVCIFWLGPVCECAKQAWPPHPS